MENETCSVASIGTSQSSLLAANGTAECTLQSIGLSHETEMWTQLDSSRVLSVFSCPCLLNSELPAVKLIIWRFNRLASIECAHRHLIIIVSGSHSLHRLRKILTMARNDAIDGDCQQQHHCSEDKGQPTHRHTYSKLSFLRASAKNWFSFYL